jgi:hypothetical protein
VFRKQGRAVHLPDEHRVGVEGDREREAAFHTVEVGALRHDVDRTVCDPDEVEHIGK